MIKWLRVKVLGGDSGSRESATLLMIIWWGVFFWLMRQDRLDVDVSATREFLKAVGIPIYGWFGIAHFGEKVISHNLFNMKGENEVPQNRGGR